eukprot:CAMPEP_0176011938 /NCGR_PEP_ID=MMETSP0120_2-20121206/5537_1 /TAXON_ID=160619 /ORGANISM="Kryptoperidinium foliaceum, Strain CCMP 1326" /LENGTH=240 /DNA_ID=CAMNT_0017344807 /DNA_START=105 /DNA_END=827 /DNA_ORIENTATION=-
MAAEDFAASSAFSDMDFDGNGYVDKEEYMYSTRDGLDEVDRHDKATRRAVFAWRSRLYEAADIDGDGVLSPKEVAFGQYLASEAFTADGADGELDFGAGIAREMHCAADQNGDGIVSVAEFRSAWHRSFEALAADADFATWAKVDNFFAQADVNSDGGLSWREWQFVGFLVSDFVLMETAVALREELDLDGNGKVDDWEVAERLPFAVDMFDSADANGDGVLDQRELVNFTASLLSSTGS